MPAKPSLEKRLTAKVGPLPVWAWALALLLVGYLIYRRSSSSQAQTGPSTAATASPPTSTAPSDATGGTVPAAVDTSGGTVGAATQDTQAQPVGLNDSLMSQLQGFQGSIDALTQTIQSSPAFWPGSGDSGSGSTVPNSGAPSAVSQTQTPAAASQHNAHTVTGRPVPIHYWTYAPGRAPKNRKRDEAPAHGPKGTTLHYMAHRGYYYA